MLERYLIRGRHRGRTQDVEPLLCQPVRRPAGGLFGLDRWFATQGAPRPIDLARSGAMSMTVAELLTATGQHPADFLGTSLDYGAGRGSARLLSAVKRSLCATADAEVVVANGAIEALLLLCIATADRGDVLVGTPTYGALLSAPAAVGRTVRTVPVWDPVGGLNFARLAAAITSATAMVVVNTPHNPTGGRASLGELDELAERCAGHGALLVVDEVARATLDPSAPSAVHSRGFADGTTVVLGDVSKSLGLGGLRIGWLCLSDSDLAMSAAAAKDGTTVASGSLSEHLAALALEHQSRLLERVTMWARANLAALTRFLDASGHAERWTPPTDGLVAFPSLSRGGSLAGLIAKLQRLEVGVVPGWLFGEADRARLGLGVHPEVFSEGLQRLARVLDVP